MAKKKTWFKIITKSDSNLNMGWVKWSEQEEERRLPSLSSLPTLYTKNRFNLSNKSDENQIIY
jgi:hypothetical protein